MKPESKLIRSATVRILGIGEELYPCVKSMDHQLQIRPGLTD